VDEMVVLDTGSTDDSVARARAAGARVAHFTWVDDFSAARNAAWTWPAPTGTSCWTPTSG
jgi:glycosyltransferase involved in cell wall biosynthesis